MSNFDEFKQRTEETAEHIAAKSIELARSAAEKTKLIGRISKLNADIITEKETLRRAYIDLGKKYYKYFRDDPEEILDEDCRKIASSIAVITECRSEIEDCKAAIRGDKDDDVTVEIYEEAPEKNEDEAAPSCECGDTDDASCGE